MNWDLGVAIASAVFAGWSANEARKSSKSSERSARAAEAANRISGEAHQSALLSDHKDRINSNFNSNLIISHLDSARRSANSVVGRLSSGENCSRLESEYSSFSTECGKLADFISDQNASHVKDLCNYLKTFLAPGIREELGHMLVLKKVCGIVAFSGDKYVSGKDQRDGWNKRYSQVAALANLMLQNCDPKDSQIAHVPSQSDVGLN